MEQLTVKQSNFILKLDASKTLEDVKNLTKKEASILIRKLLKKGNNQEKAPLTIEELERKYNLGITKTDDGRFYYGNNCEKEKELVIKWDSQNRHASEWSIGRELKEVIKNEFNKVVYFRFSWATYTPDLRFTFKGERKEFYKTFEELSEEEIFKLKEDFYNNLSRWVNMHYQPTMEDLKLYYENFVEKTMFLREQYRTIKLFINKFMKSFNYDHTGANMGDCDYVDTSMFWEVKFKLTDAKSNDEASKIWNELHHRVGY